MRKRINWVKVLLLSFFFGWGSAALANEQVAEAPKPEVVTDVSAVAAPEAPAAQVEAVPSGEVVKVVVKGKLCGFCIQGIEKKFKEIQSVNGFKSDLKKKEFTVLVKKGQKLTVAEITKVIEDSGFQVKSIKHNTL